MCHSSLRSCLGLRLVLLQIKFQVRPKQKLSLLKMKASKPQALARLMNRWLRPNRLMMLKSS